MIRLHPRHLAKPLCAEEVTLQQIKLNRSAVRRRAWSGWRRSRLPAGVYALTALLFLPGFAEQADEGAAAGAPEGETTAPDVHQAVAQFQLDLEMWRWVTGSSAPAASPWAVSEAAPRHLLWQAQVMFRKASELAQEVAGPRTLQLPPGSWRRAQPRPAPLDRDIELADVLRVVLDARERIRATIELQNIRMMEGRQPPRDPAATASDVLVRIVQANRQLHLLQHREVPPRDVYNRVMAAVNRAGDLLGGGYPPAAPLAAGQRPDDVYRRLVTCMGLLQEAAAAHRIQTLGLNLQRERARQDVSDADVYHLATTLLADLEYVAQVLRPETTRPPRGEYPMPGFVFPAHIHQLAGVLEAQLRTLGSASRASGPGNP